MYVSREFSQLYKIYFFFLLVPVGQRRFSPSEAYGGTIYKIKHAASMQDYYKNIKPKGKENESNKNSFNLLFSLPDMMPDIKPSFSPQEISPPTSKFSYSLMI